ncbi:hypothetical protein K933_00552 [Candidatus Halobonum tyrrellensis G22]|uniref:Nucleotidyltransferase family protein n=1 Tax=Candidatus Halobonum tyrrellensis G22 TaxID=1324957 RepID=V4J3Q0_9EURY|nr:hypothetical protein K933_00552 [Candidatus Halobonum tyrrellensis G22]
MKAALEVTDWTRVVDLARHHSLISQLHTAFTTVRASDLAPVEVRRRVNSLHRQNAMRNLRCVHRLHTLHGEFDDEGIRAIPYKGPVVAEFAYDDPGLRWYGDLDFLVAKEDVLDARRLLLELGYEQTNYSDVRPETLVDGTVFRWGKEFRFLNHDDQIPIELRFEFIGGSRPDATIFDELWARRTPLSLTGRTVPVLSPEDRAMLLLVHGTKHGWRRLSWVCDVALLLQRDVAWETVLARADRYDWRSAVLFGLAVVARLAEVRLPTAVERELEEHPQYGLSASLLASFLRRDPLCTSLRLEPIATVLFSNDGLVGSALELVDVVFSPRKVDFESMSLNPSLYPLYYLVRPYRIGRDLVGRLFDRG